MSKALGSNLPFELIRLGQRLRDLRLRQNWTLEGLATRTKLSKAYLSRLEAGDRQASLEVLLCLAREYQLTLSALFEPGHHAPLPGLVSVNIGEPRPITRSSQTLSSIAKTRIKTSIKLQSTGLEGDAQADLEHHGGPDRAICVYPLEHYPYWSQRLSRPLDFAAFGENFSVWGMTEDTVCIGDVYQIGSGVVQVSGSRGSCNKLILRYREPQLERWLAETGFTGFYCRVLETGTVSSGEPFRLLERPRQAPTVAETHWAAAF